MFTDEELKLLEGSPLLDKINMAKKIIELDYMLLCENIPDFKKYTLEEFKVSRVIIQSRVFEVPISSNSK